MPIVEWLESSYQEADAQKISSQFFAAARDI